MTRRLATLVTSLALLTPALVACTSNSAGSTGNAEAVADNDSGALTVSSTADACKLSTDTAPSGRLVFSVTNDGNEVTEFYLLASDGQRIVGEVENIGPGLTRDLVLTAPPGKYVTACKPGMVGKGIRDSFTVTDSGKDVRPTGKAAELVAHANRVYAAYVRNETDQLLAQTRKFARLYVAGDTQQARHLYPRARVHWERIETVAESFGDLDPRMDLREADLAHGQKWTGWHRIEKDLWPPESGYRAMNHQQREAIADQLVTDTEELHRRTRDMTFTADQIGNGAKGLLDEVATGKVTGEEEAWSHTDLFDFQANVDGARVAFEGLQPLLERKNPQLGERIDTRFAALQDLLDRYRTKDGFVSYTALDEQQVRELSDAVNALSEPLAQLTAAVTV